MICTAHQILCRW